MFGHATAWTPSNPTLLFVQGGYQWDWVSSVWSLESDLYVLDISTIFIPGVFAGTEKCVSSNKQHLPVSYVRFDMC